MICMYVDLKGVAHWPFWMDPTASISRSSPFSVIKNDIP